MAVERIAVSLIGGYITIARTLTTRRAETAEQHLAPVPSLSVVCWKSTRRAIPAAVRVPPLCITVRFGLTLLRLAVAQAHLVRVTHSLLILRQSRARLA